MGIDKELQLSLFHQREEQRRHMEYQKEFGFYKMVVSGNIQEIKKLYTPERVEMASKDAENGVLSKDPLRNGNRNVNAQKSSPCDKSAPSEQGIP